MAAKIDEINRLYDSYNRQTQLIEQEIGQLSSLSLELSDEVGAENEYLRRQLGDLQQRTRRLEKKITSERSDAVRTALDASRSAADLREIADLRSRLAQSQAAHRAVLDQLERSAQETHNQLRDGRSQAEQLLESSCAQQAQCAALEEENARLKEEVSILMDQNETYRSGIDTGNVQSSAVQQNLAQQARLLQESQCGLIEQIRRLEAIISDKENALQLAADENARATRRIEALEQQNAQLTARVALTERQLLERGEELKASELAYNNKDYEALAHSYSGLQQENFRLKQQASATSTQAQAMEIAEKLTGDVKSLRGDVGAMRGTLLEFGGFMTQIEAEVAELQARCDKGVELKQALAWAEDMERFLQAAPVDFD